METDVRGHLADGNALFGQHRFWDAHEAWEQAWHQLKAAGRTSHADLVQGLILATAAYENLGRGKPRGAANQLRKAVRLLTDNRHDAHQLGISDIDAFVTALESTRDEVRGGASSLEALATPLPCIVMT